jgi:hypothetical protein
MSRTSLLAIAATAAVAISAFTPTNASAFGHFGGGYHGGFHGHFGYHGGFYRHYPYRFGHYGWGGYRWGFGNRYRWWYPRYGYRWYPRPIINGGLGAGPLAATSAVPTAAQPMSAAQQPNCLVKQYLPNGAVQFADTCTQEQAIAMPNGQPGPGPR